MPGTWATWGKDADGSGPPPDVNSIPDAVMAQGALMCENYKLCTDGISSGSIAGDPVALAVAAYNAGFGAVQKSGGMPSGGDYTVQTQPYVYKIMQRARAFEASPSFAGTPQIQAPTVQTGGNQAVVEAALKFKGTKWVWGGGSADGPTRDGFDSAGLTFFAVSRGTDGKVVLPRTADEQWSVGKELPLDQVQPGDLVFSGWDIGTPRLGESFGNRRVRPSHVGIAVGNGQIIHAAPGSRGRDRRLLSGIARSAGDMKRRIAAAVCAVMLGLIPAAGCASDPLPEASSTNVDLSDPDQVIANALQTMFNWKPTIDASPNAAYQRAAIYLSGDLAKQADNAPEPRRRLAVGAVARRRCHDRCAGVLRCRRNAAELRRSDASRCRDCPVRTDCGRQVDR